MTNSAWPLFKLGLNPYGMTYYLGLQGRGTSRQNPKGTGLEGFLAIAEELGAHSFCLLYTSPSPRDRTRSRMPSSA